MRLLRLALALSALVGAGCGSEGESGQVEGPILDPKGADRPVVVEDPGYTAEPGPEELPPLLDPQTLVLNLTDDAGCGVELPQLVGLTREEAQTWADQSGFTSFKTAGSPMTEDCQARERVIVSIVDGRVSEASTG